jgi:hypothetical protein
MQNAPIKAPLISELARRLPFFTESSHMLKQNPPSKQPRPSVNSLKSSDNAPNITPVKKAATKYAPCTAFETGGVITYSIKTYTISGSHVWIIVELLTVTDKAVRKAADKKTCNLKCEHHPMLCCN